MSAATVPNARPARPRRRAARWSPPLAIAATLVALVVGQAVALAAILAGGGEDGPGWLEGAALVLADAITLAIIVFAARRGADRLAPATLGLRRTRVWSSVGWAFVAWLAMQAASAIFFFAFGAGEERGAPASGPLADEGTLVLLALFLGVAVTAPIVEEIVFRGYLFGALTRWRGPWLAAVISGVMFGAAHVVASPAVALVPLAVLGFMLCLVFWFTGSLLPCIGVHAANNALVLSLAASWTWQVPVAIAASVAVALLVCAPFSRERAPQALKGETPQLAA